MGFKPFKWIKKHPWESAAILALAGTGLGAAGIGPMAGLFAGEAAGAGAAGAGAAGIGAGEAAGMGSLAAMFGPEAGFAGSLLGAAETTPMITAGMQPFAQGATTAAPGMAGMFGPGAATSAPWLTPEKAMQLAKFSGLGQQQPQQRPLGGPIDAGNPWQRPAMATQEQITKKWLMQNDPVTYARLYGQQGAM